MLLEPHQMVFPVVTTPGAVGVVYKALFQIRIVAGHECWLGLDDILQQACTGVIPIAWVGVILEQTP